MRIDATYLTILGSKSRSIIEGNSILIYLEFDSSHIATHTLIISNWKKKMKYMRFTTKIIIGIMFTFAGAVLASKDQSSTMVVFNATVNDSSFLLECNPLNETAAKDPSWVSECNEAAVDFLSLQEKQGAKFEKTIPEKPFGQAAQFTAKVLMKEPEKYSGIKIKQTFAFTKK